MPTLPATCALLVLLLASACAGRAEYTPIVTTRVAQHTVYQPPSSVPSPEQLRQIDRNCPCGAPTALPTWSHGPTRLIARDGYVLLHSSTDKIPLWACESLEPEELRGNLSRSGFRPDPLLPPGERSELSDYRNTPYDRGHMAAAGNQRSDAQKKRDTFYLSNVAPQLPELNRTIWAALEKKARTWPAEGETYVITGPLFFDPEEDDPALADGLITVEIIGAGVAVPTHFFKLAVREDADGQLQAVAFVLEHRGHARPWDFEAMAVPLDWLEARTGFDLLPGCRGSFKNDIAPTGAQMTH